MNQEVANSSLETLQEIRSMMQRSARFLTLSGWSGIWAGSIALAGAAIARMWILQESAYVTAAERSGRIDAVPVDYSDYNIEYVFRFMILALGVFILALGGGYFFTLRKNQKLGIKVWNPASRKMLVNLAIPLAAGAFICLAFIWHGHWIYVAPACLLFYGMALINSSKYTLMDVRYLGLLEILLGCAGLLFPGWGLYLWATGFGLLHILYGIIMWRKYDNIDEKRA